MSAKRKPRRISGVEKDAGKVDDPAAALERMRSTLKRILKVPKSAIVGRSDSANTADG